MLGIDIGTKHIKICQVDMRAGAIYDVYTVMKKIPDKIINDSEENKVGVLSGIIKSMYKDNKFASRISASSVGSSEIMLRSLEFPQMPKNELESSIRLQAEKYIFSDLSEMDLDFHVTSYGKTNMSVLLVAAPKDLVDTRMKVIQRSGLDAVIMDIDSIALANCFLKLYPQADSQTAILMDIGHTKTNFTILNNGKFCFAKHIDFGGLDITSEIKKELEIPDAKAVEIKENPQLWDEVGLNIKNVLRKVTPDLLEAIYRAVEYCGSQKLVRSIEKILLTGGSSELKGIDGFFSDILGIETVKWNPLLNVDLIQDKKIGRFVGIAMGLAVREDMPVD
ncbi:type IV pilus assembly protein PilM [Elusimicrobiota bacterium]